jgi:signal transduction histidine kinase
MPQVFGDRIQLEQVMLNLLRNAIDASASVKATDRCVVISGRCDSEYLELSVADQGRGLNPQVAAKLFEPFLTTKQSGLGVGLYLCRSIIESHNGRIWHTPHQPHGAEFHVSLPVIRAGVSVMP